MMTDWSPEQALLEGLSFAAVLAIAANRPVIIADDSDDEAPVSSGSPTELATVRAPK